MCDVTCSDTCLEAKIDKRQSFDIKCFKKVCFILEIFDVDIAAFEFTNCNSDNLVLSSNCKFSFLVELRVWFLCPPVNLGTLWCHLCCDSLDLRFVDL